MLDAHHLRAMIRGRIQNLEAISTDLAACLDLIEQAAQGNAVDRETVLKATGLILDNLYRGLLSPRMTVPRDFWSSTLGIAIARAHTHVIHDHEVMSQAEAALALNVSREYVSHLVETGKVPTIVREAAAPRSRKRPREMLFRSSVEALLAQARPSRGRQTQEVPIEGRA